MRSVLRNQAVLAVSLGHMAVDILSSALPVLLVAFAAKLSLSNTEFGTVATLYMLLASLGQPLFGLLADKLDSRRIGTVAMLWMVAAFLAASLLSGAAALGALVLAALGSAAYHPQGAMNARRAAGAQAASGTSLFFFFGQSGHAIGPILAGFLLAHLSLASAIWLLLSLILAIALVFSRFAPGPSVQTGQAAHVDGEERHRVAWAPLSLIAFALVVVLAGWPSGATRTFLPKWLADVGFLSTEYGALLGIFMFSSAFGTMFGGWLADRWSRKQMVVLAMGLMVVPFWILYLTPSVGALAMLSIALAGFANGMPHSVLVLMGQNLFPGRMGLGSGLIMGFIFSADAVTVWLTGWLGDQLGLHQVLLLLPWVSAVGLLCALALPRTRQRTTLRPVAARG